MHPNHIAIFLPSLAGGGAERVMLNLANFWANRGCKVDMVLVSAHGIYLDQLSPKVRVIDLNASRTLSSLFGLVSYLRHNRPHAVLAAMEHANLVAIWARLIARVKTKVAVSVHCSLANYAQPGVSRLHKLLPLLAAKFYKYADVRIAVSKGVAQEFSQVTNINSAAYTVIYNPITVAEGSLHQSQESILHPWFGSSGNPVILAAGRLSAQKDYATLLRAFALMKGEQKAKLMILGEGEKRDELECLAKHLGIDADVCFFGHVPNPYSYMTSATLFVLSSIYEGFGNVLVEAMACGTPVISTDCPYGPGEILQDGKYGALVPVGDVSALAEAMLQTIRHPINPVLLRARAAEFSVQASAQEYWRMLMDAPLQ